MREGEYRSRPHARRLRRTLTNAETILWAHLRRRALNHHRFRRQHPIGPYVVDFACVAAKLALEVDGATHWTPEQLAHDERRTAFLQAAGWQVLRITNADIYENLDGVWLTIAQRLPPPAASRPPPP